MTKSDDSSVHAFFQPYIGQKCWHVSHPGTAMPAFSLHLGEKISRSKPLHSGRESEFNGFAARFAIYIWSAWRLQTSAELLCGSSDSKENIAAVLDLLVGHSVARAGVIGCLNDLQIEFDSGMILQIFSDGGAGGEREAASTNWTAYNFKEGIYALRSGFFELKAVSGRII